MKVKSIAESNNRFENYFLSFLEWPFYTGFTVKQLALSSPER